MSNQRVQIMHCSEGLAIAEIGSLCAVIWRAEVDGPRFKLQSAALAAVVAQHPGQAGFLCVIEEQVKPPPEELRKATVAMVRQHDAGLKCIACVIEARGFMGALTRSVLAGINLLAIGLHARRGFFANVDEASEWLHEQLRLEPSTLARGLLELRANLDRASPEGVRLA